MESLQDQFRDAEGKQLEADLRACVATVFERYPALCGFSVGERLVPSGNAEEWELYVSDMAVSPHLGGGASEQFHGEISHALGEFLNERPEAADLLSGRTFARSWH